jgi:hypothetical protein
MKIVRLGMTESGLLFCFFVLKNNHVKNNNLINIFASLVNWLYTTSGYYDKEVPGSHFNFDIALAVNDRFYEFMNDLQNSVSGCKRCEFIFHMQLLKLFQGNEEIRNAFLREYNIENAFVMNDVSFSVKQDIILSHIPIKSRILVVSSFSGLIQSQYESGNIFKLGTFPEIQDLKTVTTPYCFENNGPHANYRETLNYIFDMIESLQDSFDLALLSCGCYGHMLTHRIHMELKKDAIYVGGPITRLFGICNARDKRDSDLKTNEFWITNIPDEYKPHNFKNIENGCYW